MVGISDIKNAHLHWSFLVLTQFTIPKKPMFFAFQILAFLAGKDVTKFPPNFVFNIMGYLMMVSERRQHKDVKKEKMFEICLSTQKI